MLTVSRDPLVQRLSQLVRSRLGLATRDELYRTPAMLHTTLRDIEVYRLEAPIGMDGYDLGLTAGVTVCYELGRAALPNVYAGPALVADAVAAGDGPPGPAVAAAAGELPVGLAGLNSVGGHRQTRCCLRAEPDGPGRRLSGRVVLEKAADDAALCVPVSGSDGHDLVLLPVEARQAAASWVVPGLLRLELLGTVVAPDSVVGRLGSGAPLSDPDGVLARARVRQAAYLVGMAQGAQSLAVGHARRRQQFGRPLVDLQSVRLILARSAVSIRAALLGVYHAAWLAGRGEEIRLAAAETAARSAEVAMATIRESLQLHGAIGLTLAAPIHRYYRLAGLEVGRFGAPASLWQEAGSRRLARGPNSSAMDDCTNRSVARRPVRLDVPEAGHAVPA